MSFTSKNNYRKELEQREIQIKSDITVKEKEQKRLTMNDPRWWELNTKLRLLFIDKETVRTRIAGLNKSFSGIQPIRIDENQFLNKNR